MDQCNFKAFTLVFCIYLLLFYFSSFMDKFLVSSLNINGCRDDFKRAQFFNFIEFKKANFILLQETHSDSSNEAHWLSEWKGKAILSHGSNVSAGLAVLFSPGLGVDVVSVEEVVQGSLLKIELKLNGVFIDLFNIYAPNLYNDRILFFKKLNQVLEKCDPEHFILFEGILTVPWILIMTEIMMNPIPNLRESWLAC